jgi:hypothetical protein
MMTDSSTITRMGRGNRQAARVALMMGVAPELAKPE